MAGLLDFFDDPQTQLGLGLLAAGSARADGAGLGQRLMEGVQSAQGMRDAQMKRNMTQLQFDSAMRRYQLVNDAMAGENGQPMQSAQPTQAAQPPAQMGQLGSGTFGIVQPPAGQPDIPVQSAPVAQPAPVNNGWSTQKIRAFAMSGDPGLQKAAELEQARQLAAQTDIGKLMAQAGIDPNTPLGKQIVQQQIAKQNNIPLVAGRAGAPMFDASGSIVAMAPKIPDNAVPEIVGGKVVGVSPLKGAASVEQINAYAGAAGKNQAEPMEGVDKATGLPIFTNKLNAAQGGESGLRSQISAPMGADPKAIDREIAATEQGLATVKDAASKQQLSDYLDSLKKQKEAIQPSVVLPKAPAGFNESQGKLATAGAERYTQLVNQASESPVRVGVYDNIINLSKNGVQTGKGQAFYNDLKGYVANAPLLGNVAGKWKDDITGSQELGKFLYQNAQRNWQAAGGTGTDAQLEAQFKANPNETMTPKALQAMAQWGKAGELALQGKANAAQAWKDAQGGNVVNQDQFERTWRNNFDPMIYQLKTMPPEEAQKTVADLQKSNPTAYASLMLKAQQLKKIGGL